MNSTSASLFIIEKLAPFLEDHQTEDLIVLDVSEICSFTDFFLITTVRSQVHMHALVKYLQSFLKEHRIHASNHLKNKDSQGWYLLDCHDFVIHLMEKDTRDFYELEKLWFKSRILYQSSKLS